MKNSRKTGGLNQARFTAFDFVNYFLLILLSVSVVYPLLYLFSLSLSTREGLAKADSFLFLWPQGFSVKAYTGFLRQEFVYTGFYQTILRTVVGTVSSVALMSMAAYSLSKSYLPLKRAFTLFFVFTMFFSGGLIPTYLLIKDLGLIDNTLVYILAPPFLYNTFYLLIIRNFFLTIPSSLEESARIDGANDIVIFFRIILPISKPIMATMCLWVAVNHWNSWFDSIIYITTSTKYVIQVHIRNLVIEQSARLLSAAMDFYDKANIPTPESMRAAGIFITLIPILCAYPFLQKYFVKGVIIGAVKG